MGDCNYQVIAEEYTQTPRILIQDRMGATAPSNFTQAGVPFVTSEVIFGSTLSITLLQYFLTL